VSEPSTSAPPVHRLALARQRAGLSLGQAAQMLGMQRPALEQLEAGPTPDELTCARLARLYEVNIPWLRGDVPERAPESELSRVVCTRGGPLSEHDRDELLSLIASLPKGRER